MPDLIVPTDSALTKYKKILESEQAHIAKREKDVENQYNYLMQEKSRIAEDVKLVESEKIKLGIKEKELDGRELLLSKRDNILQAKELVLDNRDTALNKYESALTVRKGDLTVTLQEIYAERDSLAALKKQYNSDFSDLEKIQKAIELDKRAIEIAKRKNREEHEDNVIDAKSNRKKEAELEALATKLKNQ